MFAIAAWEVVRSPLNDDRPFGQIANVESDFHPCGREAFPPSIAPSENLTSYDDSAGDIRPRSQCSANAWIDSDSN